MLLSLILLGCIDQAEGIKAKPGSDTASFHPSFGLPIIVPQTDQLLIPFGVDSDAQLGNSFGSGYISAPSSGSFSYGASYSSGRWFDAGDVHWNNVVIYDKTTRRSHLLLDHRAVICRYLCPQAGPDGKIDAPPQYFLFGIADTDTNGDGVINSKDAVILYVSDAAGTVLTPVTPPGAHFEEAATDSGGKDLYVRITTDANGDRKFDFRDPTSVLRVDPIHPSIGVPVFDDALRERAFHIVVP